VDGASAIVLGANAFEAFFRRRGKRTQLYYYRINGLQKRGIAFVAGLYPSSIAKLVDLTTVGQTSQGLIQEPQTIVRSTLSKKMLKGRPHFMQLVTNSKQVAYFR
jgi:hypothetical protein